jgi:hypothetical protein
MIVKWLALRDSNPRLADYEPAVLTAELRAGEFRGHVGTATGGHGATYRGDVGQREWHYWPGGSEARWTRKGHSGPGKWSSEGESNPHRPVRSRAFCPLNYLTS